LGTRVNETVRDRETGVNYGLKREHIVDKAMDSQEGHVECAWCRFYVAHPCKLIDAADCWRFRRHHNLDEGLDNGTPNEGQWDLQEAEDALHGWKLHGDYDPETKTYDVEPEGPLDLSGVIDDLQAYIDSTQRQHYADNIQLSEYIIANDEALDFLRWNAVKYLTRYGKKSGFNRNDLLKAAHYVLMLIRDHDYNERF